MQSRKSSRFLHHVQKWDETRRPFKMKIPNHLAIRGLIALLGLGVAGCQTHKTVSPLSGGYEEVAHPYHTLIDQPPSPRISFQHRNADGSTSEIWPSLYGVPEVIHGDLAIFVGDKAFKDPDPETHPRLFAVRSPELPVDITEEVLGRWAKAEGKDARAAVDRITLITPAENANGLELDLEFWTRSEWSGPENWPQKSSCLLSWPAVGEILNAVKARGVAEKDLRWHVPYIGERN